MNDAEKAIRRIDEMLFTTDKQEAERARAADRNVEAVVDKLRSRSDVGVKKYGVTTADAGLSHREWLKHLQEELMDACVYIEAALTEQPKDTDT